MESDINGNKVDDESSEDLRESYKRKQKNTKRTKRELIQKYESVRKSLRDQNSEANKGAAGTLALNLIKSLHDLYDSIQSEKNRDTKVHFTDSEVLRETSQFAATNAKNMKFEDLDVSIDQQEFLPRLKRYLTGANDTAIYEDLSVSQINDGTLTNEDAFNTFDWLKLGTLYYQVSKKAIISSHLNGSLTRKSRRPISKVRAVDDTRGGTLTTAQQIQPKDIEGNDDINTASMVKLIFQEFLRKNTSAEGVNFFKFFVNPFSFPQSVENLFFTSFLIKDSRLKLYVNDEGIPMIQKVPSNENEELHMDEIENGNHHIATFNYRTWQGLIDEYNITESFLDHRYEAEDKQISEDDV